MSYPILENNTDYLQFIKNLSSRKEFRVCKVPISQAANMAMDEVVGFDSEYNDLQMPGLKLNGVQQFLRNFFNPNTPYTRILANWQTGIGKSIGAIASSLEFGKYIKQKSMIEKKAKYVFVLSFVSTQTFQEDLITHHEFGFATESDVSQLHELRQSHNNSKNLVNLLATLRRRTSDKNRGGYFKFYGYGEFANKLFKLTKKGKDDNIEISAICVKGNTEDIIDGAIKKGQIELNMDLLEDLKESLMICDEIHNTYNMSQANDYGIAIQYVLDYLKDKAPRVLLMTATPLTGSATEIVDLLNILVPRTVCPKLTKEDFFDGDKFKPDTLDRIRKLATGRVSFILDSDVASYPIREFIGAKYDEVPYLLLTTCRISDFQEKTLFSEWSNASVGLNAQSTALLDMAFPNPDSADNNLGLYKSSDTYVKLMYADEKWKLENGIHVEKISSRNDLYLLSGDFLRVGNLSKYSAKYAKMIEIVHAAIKAGPGKILIYHPKVRMSGVILIQEILRINGICDESSSPTENTLCSMCGKILKGHSSDSTHTFIPCRYTSVNGELDKHVSIKNIEKFNLPSNQDGHSIRIIVGSKMIQEGLNFKAVRHQIITSMPTDFPSLIQVFGRVVRKNSHVGIKNASDRNVKIYILVSILKSGDLNHPDFLKYVNKGKEYIKIQQIERELRTNAIDSFNNMERISYAQKGENSDNLQSLKYEPTFSEKNADSMPLQTYTFDAYNYNEKEINIIMSICGVLFSARSVWSYDDLWNAVKSGVVKDVQYLVSMIDEKNFAIALKRMGNVSINGFKIVDTGSFFIKAKTKKDDRPIMDVEIYLRESMLPGKISIKAYDYIKTGSSFDIKVTEFANIYLVPSASGPIEMCLLEYSSQFHFALVRKIISSYPSNVTGYDEKLIDLYKRFKFVITKSELTVGKENHTEIAGYVGTDSVYLYNTVKKSWYSLPKPHFNIGKRHEENNFLIGYISSQPFNDNIIDDNEYTSALESFAGSNIETKFKIRPSLTEIKNSSVVKKDMRSVDRGIACESVNRLKSEKYLSKIRAIMLSIKKKGGDEHDQSSSDDEDGAEAKVKNTVDDESYIFRSEDSIVNLSFAAKYDRAVKTRFPSTTDICDALKLHLLAMEEYSRRSKNGMLNSTRWMYLLGDTMPSMAVIFSKSAAKSRNIESN